MSLLCLVLHLGHSHSLTSRVISLLLYPQTLQSFVYGFLLPPAISCKPELSRKKSSRLQKIEYFPKTGDTNYSFQEFFSEKQVHFKQVSKKYKVYSKKV